MPHARHAINHDVLTFTGVRQEQDLYVRLIDSVTKQVSATR